MENKVGDNVPTPTDITQLLDQLKGIVLALKKFGIILSTPERKSLLHARIGAEPHIARIHDLAIKHKVDIAGIPLEGMKNDLALYTMLRPFQDEFNAGGVVADDTAGQAESEAWEAFLAYYGTLCGMAKHQADLASELAPVIEFMATGRKKTPAASPPKG